MSDEPDYVSWFQQNHPTEFFLIKEISKEVDKVYARSRINTDAIPIDLFQTKTQDGFSRLGIRDSSIVFYGVMAKTIIDTISKNLQAELGPKLLVKLEESARKAIKEYAEQKFPRPPSLKRCQKCNYDNDFNHNYCGQCGTKL